MKSRWSLTLLPLLTCFVLSAFAADAPTDFTWKKRVVLIATPSLDDARYQQQAAELLPAWAELNARNLEIIVALPGDPRRARLAAKPEDFLVAVIGLDGGIKLVRRDLLSRAALYREIESASLQRVEKKSADRAQQKTEPPVPLNASAPPR